ncbi:MAG TPA: PAS domain-containing protein, partial [Flavisolibacter sp.]
MHELKTSTGNDTRELTGRTVTIFLESHFVTLTGRWNWDFVSDAIFCSNVMFFLQEVEATKAIIHPDDVEKVRRQLEEDDIGHLEFRLITTYGEVKSISGDMLSAESRPSPLEDVAVEKNEFNKKLASQKLDELIVLKEVYEKTASFTGAGIWLYNEATNETWYSPEVFRIHGLAPFSLNAHLNTFLHLVHPEDRDIVEEYTVRSFKEKTPLHIEYRIQTVVGEKHIQHISQWIFSEKGESILSGMLKDITEEKKKDREVEELERQSNFLKQQLLFDEQQRNIAHWSINLVTRKFDCSGNYPRLFGIREKVLTDYSTLSDFIHPDDRTAYRLATKKMLQQHTAPEINFRVYRADGKLRYLSQKAKLVSEGVEFMMIGTLEDVTARIVSQDKIKELTEAEAVRSFAQRHSEEMTGSARWIWNTTDNSIQWSEGFYSLLGLKTKSSEITHKFFLSMVHPEDRELIKNQMNLLLQQKQESSFNLRLQLFRTTKYLTASFRLMK